MAVQLVVIERKTGAKGHAVKKEDGRYYVSCEGHAHTEDYSESTFKKYFKLTGETLGKEETKSEKKVEEKDMSKEMNEKREKVIEKVKKLLALADNNPSEKEAMAAALKAQALMAEYHIEEKDVAGKVVDEITTDSFEFVAGKNNNHKWKYSLSNIVAKNFRCEVYYHGKHDVRFYGYKTDIELARNVFEMLYVIGDKLGSREYVKAVKETGSGKGVYNSFVLGFLKGVREALEKQCTALMIIIPKEVTESYAEFAAKNCEKMKGTQIKGTLSVEHYNKGVTAGKETVNSNKIESKN